VTGWIPVLSLLGCAASLAAQSPTAQSPPAAAPPPAPEQSAPGPASAAIASQPQPDQGISLNEEIVVTANREPAPLETVGSSVTVISREEIERRQSPSVLDLLRSVPGLEINQTGGPGGLANIFMRGADPTQTLVLVDGVPVDDTTGGGFDFSAIRSDNIDRIEILRGPQSTLYGSEAMGGVISIITQRGSPGFHAFVDARDGSRDGRQLTAGIDGGTSGFDYSVSVGTQHTDGQTAPNDEKGNPFSTTNASARLGFALPTSGRVDLTLRNVDAITNLDTFVFGLGPVEAPDFVQHRRLSVASLQLVQPLASFWNLRLTAGIDDESTRGTDIPQNPDDNYEFRSRHEAFGAESDFKLWPHDTLVVGASQERRDGDNAGAFSEAIDIGSFYLQDNWSLDERLFLTGGVRNDHYSQFGDKTTYRFTASYSWPASWRLFGSLGTGFRGPTFDELFFPDAGNLHLRPETSEGADLGVEREFFSGALTAGATLFENRFRNLIDFDFTSFTYANTARADAQGVEATLRLRPRRDLQIQGSYTYTSTKDLATDLPLARRPRDRYTLVAMYDPTVKLRGSLALVAVDHRIDSDGTNMDSYQRIDLSFEYRLRSWLSPYFVVQNALNERYEEIPGYPSPRVWAFLGIRLRTAS
jgi:vitamin B12 transporter